MKPPYYAVIFTSIQSDHSAGYADMAAHLEALAKKQRGYLGMDHARSEIGITISYWESETAIVQWKLHTDHLLAQKKGKSQWYKHYSVRVCRVEREYSFHSN